MSRKHKRLKKRVRALERSLGRRSDRFDERLRRLEADLGFSLGYRLSGDAERPASRRIVSRVEALEDQRND